MCRALLLSYAKLFCGQIEAIIRERFGVPACRIFRLLLLKSNLEQKQVSELVISQYIPNLRIFSEIFSDMTGHDSRQGYKRAVV